MGIAVEVYRSEHATVCKGLSEVIVYGSGFDWMLQYANITNDCEGWRRWYGKRDSAEKAAKRLASKPYQGRFAVDAD